LPDTVWRDPGNEPLRKERDSLHMLEPGDKLTVPDLRLKQEAGGTETRHRFRRKAVPDNLKLTLTMYGQPRANLEYRIDLDGKEVEGATDADGVLEVPVIPNLDKATLYIGEDEKYTIELRTLRPAGGDDGLLQRLSNMGYIKDADVDEDELRAGIELFQVTHGDLKITGELDDDTVAALSELHGS
jgi:hypothetical protein